MKQTVFQFQDYLMSSHSETRWAGMMDALRLQWVYEPALLKTRHGMYLPDFYLPHVGIFLEVKGARPTPIEIEKARDAQQETGKPFVIAYGDMNLSGVGGVGGGCLMTLPATHEAEFRTFELSGLIRDGLGREAWGRYMRSGIKHSHPGAQLAGEVLVDVLLTRMDRPAREQHQARHHASLNQRKADQALPISKAEWALRCFFTRNAVRKEAA